MISTFAPLDEEATRRWLGFDALRSRRPISTIRYLRPGVEDGDAVYLTHHDGGDTEVFAESVTEMIATLRQADRLK